MSVYVDGSNYGYAFVGHLRRIRESKVFGDVFAIFKAARQ